MNVITAAAHINTQLHKYKYSQTHVRRPLRICQTCPHNKIPHGKKCYHLDLMLSGTREQIRSINRICKVPKFAILPLGKKRLAIIEELVNTSGTQLHRHITSLMCCRLCLMEKRARVPEGTHILNPSSSKSRHWTDKWI